MPVPPTKDNPHGWGYIEKRKVLEHYQLSPRVQIVVGDIIKVSKGPYWVNKDGVKVSMDKMKGQWKINGIFEGKDGIEMSIVHCWPGGLFGSTTTIRITGDEYPSPIVDVIIRRPFKVRLAAPKLKRKRRQKRVGEPAPKKVEKVEEVDWDAIKNIVGDIEDASL
jgi:hypothetical protein